MSASVNESAQEIIAFLKENKISTTEVADSLAKTGEIPKLTPVNSDDYVVGIANCMFTANGTNFYLHHQIRDISPGDIPLVFSRYCEGRAIFGDILAKFMLEIKKASAIVVQGTLRDIDEIRESKYLIWSEGFTPIGCVNKPTTPFPAEEEETLRYKYEGSILICDGCGVVAIPKKYQNQDTLNRLKALRLQERVWNYCVDTLGWDTVKTICDKAYLDDPSVLTEEFQKDLDLLKTDFSAKPEVSS